MGLPWKIKNLNFSRTSENTEKKIAKLVPHGLVFGEKKFWGVFVRGPPPAGTLPRVSANAFAGPSPTDTPFNKGTVHKKGPTRAKENKGQKERV